MDLFFAKFFGIYLIVVGLAALVRPGHFKGIYKDFFENSGLMALSGILALIIGAAIVSVHNVWVLGWPVIITIIGWWGVVKGAILLIKPDVFDGFRSMVQLSDTVYRICGVLGIALGTYLTYIGWFA